LFGAGEVALRIGGGYLGQALRIGPGASEARFRLLVDIVGKGQEQRRQAPVVYFPVPADICVLTRRPSFMSRGESLRSLGKNTPSPGQRLPCKFATP